MSFSVQMPALGESVTEGTVTRWLKQEGDRVEVDEPLLEVSTDKVDTEIPSPAAGVLERIVAGEDETVEVGGELAVIGDGAGSGGSDGQTDEKAADSGSDESKKEQDSAPPLESSPSQTASGGDEPAEKPKAKAESTGSGQAVTMPELGESVTEGTVTRWLKQVGDRVEVDEPLLEVSTDKVDTEIPSPVAGTLMEITAGEDETVDVGGQLAVIGDGEAAPQQEDEPEPQPEAKEGRKEEPKEEAREEAPQRAAAEQRDAERPVTAEPSASNSSTPAQSPADEQEAGSSGGQGGGAAPYVTPLVRKLAAEHSVDLSGITGSGVGGRIRKQDVLAAAEAAKPAPEPEPEPSAPAEAPAAASSAPAASSTQAAAQPAAEGPQPGSTVKLPRLRQVIAQRMTESLQVSAQLTTVQEVDVTRITRLRARVKADFERREGVKLTFLPFFAKAAIEALKQYPALNASIDVEKKEIVYHGHVHLAIAVDTPRGLLVPVIKNAEDLNIAGLAKRIADVAARTRDAKIGPDELSGGTFTITNIGSVGALFDTPIINQPQVAILGTGAIAKQPKVIDGPEGEVIAIRSVCYLPLTYDHRLVDGADAGRFVSAVRARLESGEFEV